MKTYTGIIKLVCLVIVAPLAMWIFTLSDTFYLYKEKNKMQNLNQTPLHKSKEQEQQSQMLPSKPILSNGKVLQLFADSLSNMEIEVTNYTPELIDSEDECKLYLGKLVCSGRYIELVRMVSILEQDQLSTKVVSLSFDYDRTKRKPSSSITMVLLLEQIESK